MPNADCQNAELKCLLELHFEGIPYNSYIIYYIVKLNIYNILYGY